MRCATFKTMEAFESVINWLVLISGFFIWLLFVPQIRLLLKHKEAQTNSLALLWGSFVIQVLVLIQVALQANWQLAFVQAVSISGVTITVCLVHYYRRFPGGRRKKL